MSNEGIQIHNFKRVKTFVILFQHGFGSGTVINYGFGSAKVRNQSTYPVPLRQKLWFLFRNTAGTIASVVELEP